jgi:hypothetical protein
MHCCILSVIRLGTSKFGSVPWGTAHIAHSGYAPAPCAGDNHRAEGWLEDGQDKPVGGSFVTVSHPVSGHRNGTGFIFLLAALRDMEASLSLGDSHA